MAAVVHPPNKMALEALLPEVDPATLVRGPATPGLLRPLPAASACGSEAGREGADDDASCGSGGDPTAASARTASQPSRPARPARLEGGARSLRGYLQSAPEDFGAQFAHRLRWEHAVNSRQRLAQALAGNAHLLEADISSGTWSSTSSIAEETAVCLPDGSPVICAHYPTERSSDLSVEEFVTLVLRHNVYAAHAAQRSRKAGRAPAVAAVAEGVGAPAAGEPAPEPSTEDEAAAFAAELDGELSVSAEPLIPVCLCSRKRPNKMDSPMRHRHARKGIKLDFKLWSCVEPTLRYLRKVQAVEKLDGHVWLNADVFAGPGSLLTPLDARNFVRLCAELAPNAVLSLGWGATVLSTHRRYTHEMIQHMIELCMCPLIEHSLPSAHGASGDSAAPAAEPGGEGIGGRPGGERGRPDGLLVAPAAACQHITFAVAVEYALASVVSLNRLLEYLPGASLTIYSGVGSLGVTSGHVQDLLKAFGTRRCFFDVKVTRPWKSWIFGSSPQKSYAVDAPAKGQSSCGPPHAARPGRSQQPAPIVGGDGSLIAIV